MQGKLSHILFVDDNADTGQLVSLILESGNYRVTCAPTVRSALELLAANSFDLYLLDSRLPDGDGIDLCKRIRESDPAVPILFFSAAAYETDKRRAIQAGADGYLTKPIDPKVLLERVSCALESGTPARSPVACF